MSRETRIPEGGVAGHTDSTSGMQVDATLKGSKRKAGKITGAVAGKAQEVKRRKNPVPKKPNMLQEITKQLNTAKKSVKDWITNYESKLKPTPTTSHEESLRSFLIEAGKRLDKVLTIYRQHFDKQSTAGHKPTIHHDTQEWFTCDSDFIALINLTFDSRKTYVKRSDSDLERLNSLRKRNKEALTKIHKENPDIFQQYFVNRNSQANEGSRLESVTQKEVAGQNPNPLSALISIATSIIEKEATHPRHGELPAHHGAATKSSDEAPPAYPEQDSCGAAPSSQPQQASAARTNPHTPREKGSS